MVFLASLAQRHTEGAGATKTKKDVDARPDKLILVGTVSATPHQNVAVTGGDFRFYKELKWRG